MSAASTACSSSWRPAWARRGAERRASP